MTIFFDNIIMLSPVKTKEQKEKFHSAKKTINTQNVHVDSIVIIKLVETKTNSKYLLEYLEKFIICAILIMPKRSGYDKTFKVKDEDKDKNNKLMSSHIGDEKL